MADGSNALFCSLAAAGAKRIRSDVDVVATMLVLVGEPCHISALQGPLQLHNSLHGRSHILPAKQDSYRLFQGKTTSEEAGGNLTHGGTSSEWDRAGL